MGCRNQESIEGRRLEQTIKGLQFSFLRASYTEQMSDERFSKHSPVYEFKWTEEKCFSKSLRFKCF